MSRDLWLETESDLWLYTAIWLVPIWLSTHDSHPMTGARHMITYSNMPRSFRTLNLWLQTYDWRLARRMMPCVRLQENWPVSNWCVRAIPNLSYSRRKIAGTRRNILEILSNQTEIRLYLPRTDSFGTKQTPSVWFQINRCTVNTIWFWFDLIRFRKDFSGSYRVNSRTLELNSTFFF